MTEPAVDRLVAEARRGISLIAPRQAAALQGDGALLVDTRPAAQREEFGEIPGAIVIERNALEWRLDPTSPHRHPSMSAPDHPVVVFCQAGFASSLAVASLNQLGLRAVHDLDGGFEAWAAAGLPVVGGQDP